MVLSSSSHHCLQAPSPTTDRGLFDWREATWSDTLPGDRVLGEDGHTWEVKEIDPRYTSHKATVTHGKRTFTFSPDHTLPVRRVRGETGASLDVLQSALGPMEIMSSHTWAVVSASSAIASPTGTCTAGSVPCGKPAHFYPEGYRCAEHLVGSRYHATATHWAWEIAR